jgi:hypothetical protein
MSEFIMHQILTGLRRIKWKNDQPRCCLWWVWSPVLVMRHANLHKLKFEQGWV